MHELSWRQCHSAGQSAVLRLISPRRCSTDNAAWRGTSVDVKPLNSAASETEDVVSLTQRYLFLEGFEKKKLDNEHVSKV